MEMKEIWGVLAVALAFISYVPYARSFYLGQTRPHAFSWFLWGLTSAIAFFAQLSAGAGAGAWIMGFNVISCFVVAGLALKHGEREITRADWLFLAAALAALPTWFMAAEPVVAIILIMAIDALAFGPTVRKSWMKPHEEELLTYFIYIFVHVCALLAVEQYNWATTLVSGTMVLVYILFVAFCLWRRHTLKKQLPAG